MAILDTKEFLLDEDTEPKEIKLESRKGPPKEWSINPGDVTIFAESVYAEIKSIFEICILFLYTAFGTGKS